MRFTIIPFLLVLAPGIVTAQKKGDYSTIYPELKVFKFEDSKPISKKTSVEYTKACVTGDCLEGEGKLLMLDGVKPNPYGGSVVSGRLFIGSFAKQGLNFTGRVYQFERPVTPNYKGKAWLPNKPPENYTVNPPLNFSDNDAMQSFYLGTGDYNLDRERWEGEVTEWPALAKVYPDAILHKAYVVPPEQYSPTSDISWIDISLSEKDRVARYTGQTFGSGEFLLGRALLKNGDVYEGFFFRHSFHGLGQLVSKSGKVQQGIWQLDSLIIPTVLELPPVLMEHTWPKPTQFRDITAINDMAVHPYYTPEFYGDVVNNRATGWGVWKVRLKNDPRLVIQGDYVTMLAYGNWDHTNMEGAGVFIATPTAGQMKVIINQDWQNDFWFVAGTFTNGKLIAGTKLTADFTGYANKELGANDLPQLSLTNSFLYTGNFENLYLHGCGLKISLSYSWGMNNKPQFYGTEEGYFYMDKPSGFYFRNDRAKTRGYQFLEYELGATLYTDYQKAYEKVKADTLFCYPQIRRYKTQFLEPYKKRTEDAIAYEAYIKTPEYQAMKIRVAAENEAYRKKKQQEFDAGIRKLNLIPGKTYTSASGRYVFSGADYENEKLIFYDPAKSNNDSGYLIKDNLAGAWVWQLSTKQFHSCQACQGTGQTSYIESTTKVKELPWGYFSGIETKSIRTTEITKYKACDRCAGTGIILE
jgi:hypothetical protein